MVNRSPIVTTNVYPAKESPKISDPIVLIIGVPSITSKSHAEVNDGKKIITDVQLDQIKDLFGDKSELAWAIKRFRNYNKRTRIDVLPVLNPKTDRNGNAPEGTKLNVIFEGTAEKDGNIEFRPFDDEFIINLNVVNGDTPDKLAERLAANITTAHTKKNYPLVAQQGGGRCLIKTFELLGKENDGCTVRVTGKVQGIKITLAREEGKIGTDFADINFDDVVTERYHTIVFHSPSHLDEIVPFLNKRFNSRNQVLSGIGVTCYSGEKAGLKDVEHLNKVKNSQCLVMFAQFTDAKFYKSKYNFMPILLAAEFAAKRSLRLTEGEDISSLVKSPLSNIGGPNRASLAYHQTPMSYLNCLTYEDMSPLEAVGTEMSIDELRRLNELGVSFLVNTPLGTTELGDIVTGYTKDPSGYDDDKLHYLEAVDCSIVTKEYFFNKYRTHLAQTNIIKGDPRAGYDEVNELGLKAIIIGWYQDLIDMSILESSTESKNRFKEGLKIGVKNGKITINAPFEITLQIRSIIMNLYLTLRG